MKVKNAIKKVVALGAGAVMLGATVMGAAADLGSYPEPFVKDGAFGGKIVVGESADTADLLGALDIASSLQREATTEMTVSGAGVSVSDGDTEEVAIGAAVVGSGALDSTYTDSDLSVLQDTAVDVVDENINVHDEITLSSAITVVSSLSVNDKDYETDIALEIQKDAMTYCYKFDESVNLSTVTTDDDLQIEFLGNDLKLTSVSATSITAEVGKEVYLNAGDSTIVEGKTVVLDRTGGTSVVVTVDGTPGTISSGSTKTVNGLKVKVDSIFNDDGIEYDSATLIIGTDAVKTYNDGDEFIGEDETDPDWVWNLEQLTNTTSGAPVLCVENDFIIEDEGKSPAGVGEYYSFPNEFVQVGIDSLTVADDAYMKLEVYPETEDFDYAGGSSSAKTITLEASEDEGILLLDTAFTDLSADAKTTHVYLIRNEAGANVSVYFKNPNDDNRMAYAGDISNDAEYTAFGRMNYGKTEGTDVSLVIEGNTTTVDDTYLGIVPLNTTVAEDAFWLNLGDDGTDFDGFGAISTEEGTDLQWGYTIDPNSATLAFDKGTLDENLRGKYGIWVEDPKSGSAGDQFVFWIPEDQLKANAVIKSGSAAVGGGNAGTYDKINPIGVGMGILDVNANLGGTPYIVVGGPCANTIAAELMGNPAVCWDDFEEGKAKVKWFDGQNALLVAGYSAQDTVGASRVVSTWEDWPEGFAAGVDEFEVLVPTLVDLQVKTI